MKHNYAFLAGLLLLLGGGGIALGSQSMSNVSAPPTPTSATPGVSTRTSEGENPTEGSESVATYSIQVEDVYESKFFVGDTKKLTLTVTPSELAETASWWSDQPDIVSVSQDGTITCLSAGCAYIWASIKGNDFSSHADATKVYVYPAPGEVAFDQEELRLAIDSDYSEGAPGLVLMINPDEETPKGEWRIADTNIAKFLEYPDNVACGILPVSVGTTEVTFTAENGNSATCKIIVYKTLESITPTVSDSTMMVGNTFQIEATVAPVNANQPLKYESYNENVATVDSKGLVTAIAPGNTTIWLRPMYYGGVEASVNVHVVTNPDSISISNANDFNIPLGETRPINVEFTPAEFVNRTVEWTVDNPEIAEIVKSEYENDDTSFVKGLAYGKTIVRGKTPNGLTTEFEVNVYGLYDGDDSFELNTSDKSLNVGETFQIEIAGEKKGQTFNYSSEDESIATVDSLGLVTAVSNGETWITVKPSMQEWFTRSMRVTVCEAPEKVELTKTDYLLINPYTQKVELTFTPDNDNVNREINWTFDPEGIVDINYNPWEKAYFIQPLNLGQTTVTGIAANGQEIKFTAKYEGLKIDNKEAHRDYTVGDEFDLTASASSPEFLESAEWWSYNPDFISVDNGHVTCLRPADTHVQIISRLNDGYYYDEIRIISHPEAGQVGIHYDNFYNGNSLIPKGWSSYPFAILPLGEETYDGVWSVDGEGVVELSNETSVQCKITGLEEGTATLTYTMPDGRSASVDVIVYTPIEEFSLNSREETLAHGKTFQIETTDIYPEEANPRMIYTSENEEIATVDSTGLVTAVGFGDVEITVKPQYQDWPTRSLRIYVKEGPDSVVMENKDIILNGIGYVVPLDIKFSPDDENIDRTINWTYSEEGIIAIEKDYWNNGYVVRSEDFGTVTFTGEASNGQILEGTATVRGIYIEGEDPTYLHIGDSHQFEVKASSEEILNSVRWSTGNSAIAEVDETGNVTAIQPGEAYLWASGSEGSITYENNKVIIVYPEEGSIALNQPSIEMPQGYYTQLSVILPEGESIYDGVWSVSDESIIEVDYQEYKHYGFRTKATGTTTITYTMADGRSASCVVTVKGDENDRVESITLESYQEYGKIGGEFQMQATANPDTYGRTIRYYSENPDVATVDSEGLVRYVGYGSTKISAYVDNSNGLGDYIYAQMDVMIYEEPAAVTVEEGEEITVDTPQDLTPISIEFEAPEGVEPEDVCTDIVWEYSIPEVIDIVKSDPTSRARIRAMGTRAGETNAKTAEYAIKAKDFGTVEYWGYSPYDTEKTNPLVSGIITIRGIIIDADALDCYIDETATVTVRTSGDDVASNLTVNTDDQNIARLVPNSDGSYTVRGLNLGYTTLNAVSVVDGVTYSASTPVNVMLNPAIADKVESISLDSRDLFLYIFDTRQLTATVLNGYGSEMTSAYVSWTSSNPEVATVGADGSVTPAGYGSTIITASVSDRFGNIMTATCEVYVIRYSTGGGSGDSSGVDALFGEDGTCDIYNVNGEVVRKNATKADFDALDKGIYLIRKDNQTIKIVK